MRPCKCFPIVLAFLCASIVGCCASSGGQAGTTQNPSPNTSVSTSVHDKSITDPNPGPSNPVATQEQFVQAFTRAKSTQWQYGRESQTENKRGKSFYMALGVTNVNPNFGKDQKKCVDDGFIAWLRKWFSKQASHSTLVVSITGPGDNRAKKIPLFEISKSEITSPPTCVSDMAPTRVITQYYLAEPLYPFIIDAEILVAKETEVSVTHEILATASDLLKYTGGSAQLTTLVADSAVKSAASKIDNSLAANWSSSDQTKYHFDIAAWPQNNDWNSYVDQAKFAVPIPVASSMGIEINQVLTPVLTIEPVYLLSLFGGGPGKYYSSNEIMNIELVTADGRDLVKILLDGIEGFSIDNSMSLQESKEMNVFCTKMQDLFAAFLTEDDALAARYAVLDTRTNFNEVLKLQQATKCLSSDDRNRLLKLNTKFVVEDLVSRQDDRYKYVDYRIRKLAKPLINNSKDALTRMIDDMPTFAVALKRVAQDVLPCREGGKPWEDLTGQAALDQLVEAGGFDVGCGQAKTGQILKNIVAVARNRKTEGVAALLITFTNPDPTPDADPKQENPKIKKLSFYPIEEAQELIGLPNWPETDCPLLKQ